MSSVLERLQKLPIGRFENRLTIGDSTLACDDGVLIITSGAYTHLCTGFSPQSTRLTLTADRLLIDQWTTHSGMVTLNGSPEQLDAAAEYFGDRGFELDRTS